MIWCVRVLPDGTIVSGSSLGRVEWWDWRTTTLLRSIRAHDADVLALDVSKDGSAVYSASIDRKIVQYRQTRGVDSTSWVNAHSRRYHSNDVKAVCVVEANGVRNLLSGGVDTELCSVDLGLGFSKAPQRRLDEFHIPRVSVAPVKQWILARLHSSLRIYKLGSTKVEDPLLLKKKSFLARLDVARSPSILAELRLKDVRNIECAVLSPDGAWLAVSHMGVLKLWYVVTSDCDEQEDIRLIRVHTDGIPSLRCISIVAQNSNSQWRLCGVDSLSNTIRVYELNLPKEFDVSTQSPVLLTTQSLHSQHFVTHLSLSLDGRFMASTDSSGRGYIIDFNSRDGMLPSCCNGLTKRPLPYHPKHSVTSLQFLKSLDAADSQDSHLLVTFSNNDFHLLCAPTYQEHRWTITNMTHLGKDFRERKDFLRGGYFLSSSKMLLWSSNWLLAVDLSRDLSPGSKRNVNGSIKAIEEKKAGVGCKKNIHMSTHGYDLISRYQRLMHMEVLNPNCMMVVERPWVDLLESLPEAFAVKRYGM
jgi:U3 small nucleolar RNA-associated protein 4